MNRRGDAAASEVIAEWPYLGEAVAGRDRGDRGLTAWGDGDSGRASCDGALLGEVGMDRTRDRGDG